MYLILFNLYFTFSRLSSTTTAESSIYDNNTNSEDKSSIYDNNTNSEDKSSIYDNNTNSKDKSSIYDNNTNSEDKSSIYDNNTNSEDKSSISKVSFIPEDKSSISNKNHITSKESLNSITDDTSKLFDDMFSKSISSNQSDIHTKIIKKYDIKIPKKYNKKLDANVFFTNTLVIFKTILSNFKDNLIKFENIDNISKYVQDIKNILADITDKIYDEFFLISNMELIKKSKKVFNVNQETRIECPKDDVTNFCVKYFIYNILVGENVCKPLDIFLDFFKSIDLRDKTNIERKDYVLSYRNKLVDSYDNMSVTLSVILSFIFNSLKS